MKKDICILCGLEKCKTFVCKYIISTSSYYTGENGKTVLKITEKGLKKYKELTEKLSPVKLD